MSEWRPIETAPKDGTLVIGCWRSVGEGRHHVGAMEYRVDWWWPLIRKQYTGWCVPNSGPTATDPISWMPFPEPTP